MVLLSDGDVRRAHERLGGADEIIAQRRVLYATAVELYARPDEQRDFAVDVLDNPLSRGHLGEVLGGQSRYSITELRPVTELIAPGFDTEVGGHPVRLASAPPARSVLRDVVRRVTAELQRYGDENGGPELLTTDRRAALATAYGHLCDGVRLAARIAPALALDLLRHVFLFAVVADGSGRLGSASAREFPGLVLFPEPRSALEVAEALIHEGAHQKFFDLAMTRSIFGPRSSLAPPFVPSWASPEAPAWPLEQTFAAWHAYRCLGVFAGYIQGLADDVNVHDDSLLPKATDRARELGDWLRQRGAFLGADAHELIGALDGSRPSDRADGDGIGLAAVQRLADETGAIVRPAGSRTLIATRSTPPDLYWVRQAAL
jgi:hypothetical protein